MTLGREAPTHIECVLIYIYIYIYTYIHIYTYIYPQLGIQDDARKGGADAAEAYISLHPRAGLAKQLKLECCQCGPCQRGAARPPSQR
jgi:hypothetical protein